MSRLNIMSRGGYIVHRDHCRIDTGPTGIAAATVAYTGIEGTNGATATVNHADVTSAGQLLTTEANPSTFVQTTDVNLVGPSSLTVIAKPTTNDALIVTTIHYDVYADTTPGTGQNVVLFVETGSTCTSSVAGTFFHHVNPGSDGEIDMPVTPGLVIAKGDALCGIANGSVDSEVSVSGYTVSSTDAPPASAHSLAVPRQK